MKKETFHNRTLFASLLLTFLLSTLPMNFAQVTVIKGMVIDQEGNPLKNVKIILLDPARGLKFNLKSDKKGNFLKVGIPHSVYEITAQLEGYFPFESQVGTKFGGEEKITIKLQKIPTKMDEDKDFSEGFEFFEQRKYKDAVASFEKVIQKFPANYEGYYNLGLAYLKVGNIDQAIVHFEKSIELNPDTIESYQALGECYFKKGESEKAATHLAHAVKLQPDNSRAHYNLGVAYDKMNKPTEALQSYQIAIELRPELSPPYYQAALASIKLENFKGAIEYFEKFLKIEPDAPEASQVKAMIEELKKRIDDSIPYGAQCEGLGQRNLPMLL